MKNTSIANQVTVEDLATLFEEFAKRIRGLDTMEGISGQVHLKTENEMAKMLCVSPRHLFGLRQQRLIPFIRLGRLVRYNPESVSRALEKLTIRSVDLGRRC